MIRTARHSIARGAVVLCNLPPYSTQPWLSMGVVLHHALLAEAGISARVVRPVDPPFAVPERALVASLATFTFDPTMEQRLSAMAEAEREAPDFFAGLADVLLAGGEAVIGLSLFRNNVDVSLWVAKKLKERRPEVIVVLGGPEAIEEPEALLLPWIDVVVGADAEAVIVPLMRALLDRRFDRAAALRHVWVSPRLAVAADHPARREASPLPELPVINFAPLMPLLAGDREPTAPVLLNWGCPYHCSFCSNRSVYSRFTQGSVERVLAEMDGIVAAWRAIHAEIETESDASPPGLSVQISDATTNALPAQLDELLRGVIDRAPRWGMSPHLRGQTLFDARLTEERVSLMRAANFVGTFFGLDAASDGQRRALQKPATAAQAAQAMELWHRGVGRGLTFGVPVGMPGETEEMFQETARFVERSLAYASSLESITVLPYVWFLSAQDPAFTAQNKGARRGVLWRSDAPGGDPAVRARRMMELFDRVGGRAPVLSPIPPFLALPAMLPGEDPARIEAWMERHGRVFDQIVPRQEAALRESAALLISGLWSGARRALTAGDPPRGWAREGFEWRSERGEARGLVAVYRREQGEERVAVLVEARDPERRSFATTRDFAVSYLKQWRGLACSFDAALVQGAVRALAAGERAG